MFDIASEDTEEENQTPLPDDEIQGVWFSQPNTFCS
jgi:hypothetical protein